MGVAGLIFCSGCVLLVIGVVSCVNHSLLVLSALLFLLSDYWYCWLCKLSLAGHVGMMVLCGGVPDFV